MFGKVVWATDGSPAADLALSHAKTLVTDSGGELLIVLPISDETGLAGLGVFAGDADRVTAILDGDPGVQAGIFRYELHPARGFPGAALS